MLAPVDPKSYRPKYVQVADSLRKLIASGRFRPGMKLPAVGYLAAEAHVSVATVRRALGVLATEQLVHTEQGIRAIIAEPQERRVEHVQPGDRVRYRVATYEEHRQLGIAEGESVAEVTKPGGEKLVFAAHEVEFLVGEPEG